MPPLEQQFRSQRAVLWMAVGFDDYGVPKVAAPVEIDVRWDETQSETKDAKGDMIQIDATVVVDRVITPGSVMWLGDVIDLLTPPTNLKRVVSYQEVPDIRNRHVRKLVTVARLSDNLFALA